MDANISAEKKVEILLDEWKLAAEMADRVSARRMDANKLYISLLSGLLAVLPLATGGNAPLHIQQAVFVIVSILGVILCGIWMLNLRSYRQLNSLKFKTIQELEQELPFGYYTREWKILKERPYQSYTRLTKVEAYVPLLLAIPYIITFIYGLISF